MLPKIIFLDIEGVLASLRHDVAWRDDETGTVPEFDPVAAKAINDSCKSHGCKIVIISDWADEGKENLLRSLVEAGIDANNLHDDWRVDNIKLNQRGAAISRWCKNHQLEQTGGIVILDDKDGKYTKIQQKFWIQPDTKNGLSTDDIECLKSLFTEEAQQSHARKIVNSPHKNRACTHWQ